MRNRTEDKMSTYYLSAAGNDAADGLTPESAWKTVAKMKTVIKGGDTVKFRCGDTFYGQIVPPDGISIDEPTTFTSYGEGTKPVISQYKIVKSGAWQMHDQNIFKLDLTDPTKVDGNTTEIDTNVGFMKISGKIFFRKRFRIEELADQWDFYCDDQYVYVLSGKCPDELSDDIRLACNIQSMRLCTNQKVTNIIFKGTGAHGLSGVSRQSYVSDCEFHEIGGSRLGGIERNGKFNRTRYGNGIEYWSNSCNAIVENCKFSEIYDVAITMQGTRVQINWDNMYFRNNVIWNCTQAFEIWSKGELPDTGFTNCYFENNVCIDSGYGWGYDARPNKGCACHLLIYMCELPLCDVTIRNNVFSRARTTTIFKTGGPSKYPADVKVYDNVVIRHAEQEIFTRGDCTAEENAVFEAKFISENQVFNTPTYR